MPVLAAFAIALVLVLYQALRRPVLRRLAFRDAVRRPTETALVVIGSLLGTALITGSFIVGDTLDASVRATATTQLGPIDEVVDTPALPIASKLEKRLRAIEDPRIDGVTSIVAAQAAVASRASGKTLAEPRAQAIELDFAEGRGFGGDARATGIRGDTPEPGQVALGRDLAELLEVGAGDRVTVYLFGSKLRLEVVRVLPKLGIAGFWEGLETTSMNAFVAPGVVRRAQVDAPPGALPATASVLVSNRGDVEGGADLSGAVSKVIEDAFPAGAQLRVDPLKSDRLDRADREGDAFGEIFLAIGAFAIVAGILLLVNIFVMLSEERKSQLGMLRAIGMSRSHLIRAFVIEGGIYSLTSSLLGAALGVGVGWAIVKLAAPIFSGFDQFSLDLAFAVERDSIVTGLGAGGLISIVTVTLTSFRIARVNIIRAIRELPEPRTGTTRRRTLIAGIVVAVAAVAWFVSSLGDSRAWAGTIAGPPIAAFALLPVFNRFVSPRVSGIAVSGASLFWGIFGNSILGDSFFESGEIFAFVLQGVLLTFSAVVLISQSQETLEGGIRRVAARRLALRLSIAYPLARRFRTGLTLGMFALVIFTMVFISTLSNVFGAQVDTATRKEGGYDILVSASSSNPPSVKALEAQPGVERAVPLLFGGALYLPPGYSQPDGWPTSGVDADFVEGGPPALMERADEFSSDREAWRALLKDPTTVIIPLSFLQSGGGPPEAIVETGAKLEVIDPLTGRSVERTVIGKVENDFAFSGVYFSKRSLKKALTQVTPSRFYVKTDVEEGELPALAARMQGRLVANGVDAQSFRAIVEEFQKISLQFLKLMQAYLALGLLVGIAGLGVVMVRAVRERRREVGVLRALGFLSHQVRRAFVLESGFVAFEGIVVGMVLALITAGELISNGDFGRGIEFIIPWGQLAFLLTTALLAALAATAWPAQQASHIAPAVALRISE